MCVDLYLTVKNPFVKTNTRTWSFSTFSITVCSIITGCCIYISYKIEETIKTLEIAIFGTFIIFVCVSIFTLIKVTRKLLKPGFSKQVRRTVICRSVKYITAITLTFSFYFFSFFIYLVTNHRDLIFWYNFAATLLFCSLGLILSLMRLSEPLVWKTLKDSVLFFCSCGIRKPTQNTYEEADTLTKFLATSYNVELVYIILKGITSF